MRATFNIISGDDSPECFQVLLTPHWLSISCSFYSDEKAGAGLFTHTAVDDNNLGGILLLNSTALAACVVALSSQAVQDDNFQLQARGFLAAPGLIKTLQNALHAQQLPRTIDMLQH